MIVISREICRDVSRALGHEWFVSNGTDGYASASITGALTRREHGLLVAGPPSRPAPLATLAKLDEEVELGGQVYKLGTNEYSGNVISPEGFLYLRQVTFDGVLANFQYEAGRFQLTKTVWMEQGRQTTFIRYTLGEQSEPLSLTLLPLCDYRSNAELTQGREDWRFQVQVLDHGFSVRASQEAAAYRVLVTPDAVFTPLDLWYWRFQLRASGYAQTDMYVPGLFRAELQPGGDLTVIATLEDDSALDFDVDRAQARALACATPANLPESDHFSPELFRGDYAEPAGPALESLDAS